MNITMEMVGAFVAILSVLAAITGIFIARFGRVDDRISTVERALADHKVKAAESYVTMQALTTFEERLARTEERVLAETRSLRSDLSTMLAARPAARRRVPIEETE